MFGALLPLVLFTGALLVVAYIKTRSALPVFRWVVDTPDRTLRRLLGTSLVPGLISTVWLSVRGLPPPIALAIGGLLAIGVFIGAAGALGVEGALLEPGSEAVCRVAQRLPPTTSTLGRAVALAIGAALAGSASALCWWTSQV